MKIAVIDTNIASFFYGDRPELELYREACEGKRIEVGFQTVAELLQGAELRGWGAERRRNLRAFIRGLRVVPYDLGLAKAWASVSAKSIGNGRSLTDGDAWIAATAVYRRATLVTHDRDFVDLDIDGLDVVCHAPESSGGT
ncbi:MAG: PIN domain-containing protein [Planctomycetota bacterium]